jgi:hypothetical protein
MRRKNLDTITAFGIHQRQLKRGGVLSASLGYIKLIQGRKVSLKYFQYLKIRREEFGESRSKVQGIFCTANHHLNDVSRNSPGTTMFFGGDSQAIT